MTGTPATTKVKGRRFAPPAYFHDKLNTLLGRMNHKWERGGHYNADQSRDLLEVIRDPGQLRTNLKRVRVELSLSKSYEDALERCRTFLSPSGF